MGLEDLRRFKEQDDRVEELRSLKEQEKLLKEKILQVEQSLLNEYHNELEGLEYGSRTVGDIVFKFPKNITWDSDKLEDIARTLENPRDYIDLKLSVSETTFNALPANLQTLFKSARTVKPGKVNISFKD